MKIEQKEITKTRLIIYVLMAYGLTCLMGILMWYGSTKGYDLTVFPTGQMMYSAAGVTDGSEKACMTEDVVSKQTEKKTKQELEVELEEEIPVQKKKIKNLHIQADEDLWLEVQQYIYDNYDTEYLENVYIAGDGAPWIVAGCRVLEKSKFVLDKYHLGKYIHKATTHLDDNQQAAKEFIYGANNERDFDGVMRLLQKCYASTDQEYKKKEVTECARYIKNNRSDGMSG